MKQRIFFVDISSKKKLVQAKCTALYRGYITIENCILKFFNDLPETCSSTDKMKCCAKHPLRTDLRML